MKIYLNKARENWILDRLRKEWYDYNLDISSKLLINSDTIWLASPWTWKKLNQSTLKKKKVVCSIYHIDFDKFTEFDLTEFKERDKFVDYYHVISQNTKLQLSSLTTKKIISIPFWINQNNWFHIEDKRKLKEKYKLEDEYYLIGSFQRDSEGHDVNLPKLSKGPDRFLEIVKDMNKEKKVLVLLTGKRRNYIINALEENNIQYKYFEMVNIKKINELYNMLNLYIVTSRVEGGPQAILECAITKTPIISTDVGVAKEILSKESIFSMENFRNAKPNVSEAYKNSQKYKIPNGFEEFRNMFDEN